MRIEFQSTTLQRGAPINERSLPGGADAESKTPLEYCAEWYPACHELVRVLREHGVCGSDEELLRLSEVRRVRVGRVCCEGASARFCLAECACVGACSSALCRGCAQRGSPREARLTAARLERRGRLLQSAAPARPTSWILTGLPSGQEEQRRRQSAPSRQQVPPAGSSTRQAVMMGRVDEQEDPVLPPQTPEDEVPPRAGAAAPAAHGGRAGHVAGARGGGGSGGGGGGGVVEDEESGIAIMVQRVQAAVASLGVHAACAGAELVDGTCPRVRGKEAEEATLLGEGERDGGGGVGNCSSDRGGGGAASAAGGGREGGGSASGHQVPGVAVGVGGVSGGDGDGEEKCKTEKKSTAAEGGDGVDGEEGEGGGVDREEGDEEYEEGEEEEKQEGIGEEEEIDVENELAAALKSGLGWSDDVSVTARGGGSFTLEWDLRFTNEFKEELVHLRRQPLLLRSTIVNLHRLARGETGRTIMKQVCAACALVCVWVGVGVGVWVGVWVGVCGAHDYEAGALRAGSCV